MYSCGAGKGSGKVNAEAINVMKSFQISFSSCLIIVECLTGVQISSLNLSIVLYESVTVFKFFLGLPMIFGSNIIGYFSTVTYVSCNEDVFYIFIGALTNNKVFT